MATNDKNIENTHTFPVSTSESVDDIGWFNKTALSLFGGYFEKNRDKFKSYRKWMRQSKLDEGFEMYLSRVLLWFVTLLLLSIFIGIAITAFIFVVIPNIDSPVTFPNSSQIEDTLYNVGPLLLAGGLSITIAFVMAGIPALFMYLKPWYEAGNRKRNINKLLPYTITFMYALSRGGANIITILRSVSNSEDVYGDAAREFKGVLRDMEFFDSDLRTALRNSARDSPSEKYHNFIDDFISIVNTGGDIEPFLYEKTEEQLRQARREQANFLETLSLMAEIYVTAFVAGPLFVIIIITVMSLIGGSSENMLYAIVYLVLPLGNLGFAVLIDVLGSGEATGSKIKSDSEIKLEEIKERYKDIDDELSRNLYKTERNKKYLKILKNPTPLLRESPSWTLAVTIPITLIYLVVSFLIYGIPSDMVIKSIEITTIYFVVPLILIMAQISVFHELKTRRKQRILNRIPSMLGRLSSANAAGMSLKESFLIVSESTAGEIGDELKHVKNEMDWRGDLNDSLIRFSYRIDTARLSRVIKLLTKAAESTGNITEVIDVATQDIKQTFRLDKDRNQEMTMYTVIIIISFLVYLLVIVMLNESFLAKIAELAESGAATQDSELSDSAGFQLSNLPVNLYNMIFYHSTIIQGIGAGLIAGQMGSDNLVSGFKYSIAMVVIASLVFLFI